MSAPEANLQVTVAQRIIGERQPTFIVAEAGVNHDGDAAKAQQLVAAAAEAGADAIKFQVFQAATIATATASTAGYQRASGGGSQQAMLKKLELADDALALVADATRHYDLPLIVTPFAISDVKRVERLPLAALKIASPDIVNFPLLQAVAATGKPLIVSTGTADPEEVDAAVACLSEHNALHRTVFLHCVSSYPTPLEAANVRAIGALRQLTRRPVGYSDHTSDVRTGGWAVAAGACALEKHFTLDQGARGPDHALSLSPDLFRQYVTQVRAVEAALGTGVIGCSDIEREVRMVSRKSVVAACDIAPNTRVTAEMVTTKRPGNGLAPGELPKIIGRLTSRPIVADTMLTWEDLQ